MDDPNLYQPKKRWILIKGLSGHPDYYYKCYPSGYHVFDSIFDFEKFVDGIDLSKYDFEAGVE